MAVATLLRTNDIRPPPSKVCSEPSCTAVARTAAVQAHCVATSWNMTFTLSELRNSSAFRRHCSAFGEDTCITLNVTAFELNRFITGPSTRCSQAFAKAKAEQVRFEGCPDGDFAVVLGLWVTYSIDAMMSGQYEDEDRNYTWPVNKVDCEVHYGNTTIIQAGASVPVSDRRDFTGSTTTIPGDDPPAAWQLWQDAYIRGNTSALTIISPPMEGVFLLDPMTEF